MNSSSTDVRAAIPASDAAEESLPIGPMIAALCRRPVLMLGVPLLAGALAYGASYLVPPTFTARVSFLPPQQQQSAAAGALGALGALAGAAAGGIKNTGDQYVALAQSYTVGDRMVERFDLLKRYERDYKTDARRELGDKTRIVLGKRDGLIVLEVDDTDPKTAADMATAYIEEIRAIAAGLALTEAQQRRTFFEKQLNQVKGKLAEAQQALSATGVGVGVLKAEPKATAEGFAKLKAELTTAEIKLQVLRRSMADTAAEVITQSAQVAALRAEIAKQGKNETSENQNGYVTAYREYKYQEALFEQVAKQYELARIDESREGGQLQVVDAAQVPERKSKPKRSIFVLVGFGAAFVLCAGFVLAPFFRRKN